MCCIDPTGMLLDLSVIRPVCPLMYMPLLAVLSTYEWISLLSLRYMTFVMPWVARLSRLFAIVSCSVDCLSMSDHSLNTAAPSRRHSKRFHNGIKYFYMRRKISSQALNMHSSLYNIIARLCLVFTRTPCTALLQIGFLCYVL